MARSAPASEFARDLGYLDRFFDKLEDHAGGLGEASARRLRALLAEERTRWTEIRALLGGDDAPAGRGPAPAASTGAQDAPGAGAGPSASRSGGGAPRHNRGPAAAPAAPPEPSLGFTVGSLKPRR